MGCNVILLTSDNYVVLKQRSHQTMLDRGLLSTSVSGSAKSNHVINGKPHPFTTALHQAWEELGIEEEEIFLLVLTSITRDMTSGGKPHFNFIACTTLRKDELVDKHRNALDQWEGDVKGIEYKSKTLDKFIKRNSHLLTDQTLLGLKDLQGIFMRIW